MQKVLFGAGDFSPPMLIFSGLKSRAPTDLWAPHKSEEKHKVQAVENIMFALEMLCMLPRTTN